MARGAFTITEYVIQCTEQRLKMLFSVAVFLKNVVLYISICSGKKILIAKCFLMPLSLCG